MGKVGVVIPCYNHGEFLAEALESVTWQTVPVAHTVIVDDGSDKSGDAQAIYSGFRGQIPLNLVCLPYNRGPSHARNVGESMSHRSKVLCPPSTEVIYYCYLSPLGHQLLCEK